MITYIDLYNIQIGSNTTVHVLPRLSTNAEERKAPYLLDWSVTSLQFSIGVH